MSFSVCDGGNKTQGFVSQNHMSRKCERALVDERRAAMVRWAEGRRCAGNGNRVTRYSRKQWKSYIQYRAPINIAAASGEQITTIPRIKSNWTFVIMLSHRNMKIKFPRIAHSLVGFSPREVLYPSRSQLISTFIYLSTLFTQTRDAHLHATGGCDIFGFDKRHKGELVFIFPCMQSSRSRPGLSCHNQYFNLLFKRAYLVHICINCIWNICHMCSFESIHVSMVAYSSSPVNIV